MKNDLSPSDLMGLERAFQERVQQRKWAALDDHEDPAPNTAALWAVLAVWLLMLVGVVFLVRFIVAGGV